MQFTHEHREIQKTLKRFIDEEINPHVDEWEAAEIFPAHEVFKKMGNLGLLGLCKPEEYGGQGLDYSYGLAMAEDRRADPCEKLGFRFAGAGFHRKTRRSSPISSAVSSRSAGCSTSATTAIRGTARRCRCNAC